MSISHALESSILQAVTALGFPVPSVSVEPTSDPQYGDFTSNVAMKLFPSVDKAKWSSPKALAEGIILELRKLATLNSQLATITVAGPGFINFTVNLNVFTETLHRLSSQEFAFLKLHDRKQAIVEYSSPNIAKPFTVGHLRSTIIGDAIANLLSATGYEVKRDNHLGDWGTQFGKQIVAILELGAGSEEANRKVISQSPEPVKELVKLYVEFHEMAEKDPSLEDKARNWFTKLENGDPKARELWQLCIDWSWTEFSRIYDELGVKFTENDGKGFGESYFEDKMKPVIAELESSGFLKSGDDGAKLFFFPNDELPPLMILKKDGSTLYATRDLATDKFRLEKYGKEILVINEVGAEQELYFRQLYRIEELLGWYTKGQRVHVKHGLFRFKTGKMSTRKGNTIWLEDVISEAKTRALAMSKDNNEETASQVAIGALKWNDLKRSSQLDIAFDWDEILTMEGNSGAYMQYAAVRCASVLSKASGSVEDVAKVTEFNATERSLAQQLLYFEETVTRASRDYTPQLLCTYLYTLAGVYNSFYGANRILGDEMYQAQRLELTKATKTVLETGLHILGLEIPNHM